MIQPNPLLGVAKLSTVPTRSIFVPMLLTLLLVVFSSHSKAQQSLNPKPADLAIINAKILVCDPAMTRASALAVQSGRIVAIGERVEIEPFLDKSTQVIDAAGMTVTPGLIDSHLHFIGLGQSLQMLDLSEADSWSKIESQVVEASLRLPKGTWIEGRGWHQSKWKTPPSGNVDGYPNNSKLSAMVPDHPVVLTHASGHANFANEAAMKIAGVDRNTADPKGGELLRDTAGNPIGVFRENAQSLIRLAQSRTSERLSDEAIRDATLLQLQLAGKECLRKGITSVHDAGSSFATARLLKRFAEESKLPLRMAVMIREGSFSLASQMREHRWDNDGEGFLSVRSVKVSIDGALGPHGAWLLEPYSDLPTTTGLNTIAMDEFRKIAILCKEGGWQLCVHAIGDRANREVLDVYEQVLADQASSDHRWRIEHAQHLSPADIPRFGKLGVIPVMQGNHCTSDAIFVPQRLGERRSEQGAYVWRSLIDSGAIVPNGTDAPVEKVDPRVSIYAAATRQLASGDTFYPKQCMTREEALLSYTLWPARAAFQEKKLGSLEKGKMADLVMWDTDLLQCKPSEILTANVELTLLNGSIVHQ
jgi:predicted amidohydrolase YtcJ